MASARKGASYACVLFRADGERIGLLAAIVQPRGIDLSIIHIVPNARGGDRLSERLWRHAAERLATLVADRRAAVRIVTLGVECDQGLRTST